MAKFKIRSAEQMLQDLLSGYLEVVLIPAPDEAHSGHCVRAAQSVNAEWYQEFCSQYKSCTGRGRRRRSRPRTFIKRANTIKALEDIIDGRKTGIYIERLLSFRDFYLRQQAEVKRQKRQSRRSRGGGQRYCHFNLICRSQTNLILCA